MNINVPDIPLNVPRKPTAPITSFSTQQPNSHSGSIAVGARIQYSGQCPEKPQCPHHEIHDGGNEKSHSHETADIAIIRYEAIGKFAERIDEQQGGTDKSKFPGSKQPTVNQRLLDYAQCHSAYIIEAVCCRRAPKSSGA